MFRFLPRNKKVPQPLNTTDLTSGEKVPQPLNTTDLTSGEMEQLQRFRLHFVPDERDRLPLSPENCRLQFVRWLFVTGRLTDDCPTFSPSIREDTSLTAIL